MKLTNNFLVILIFFSIFLSISSTFLFLSKLKIYNLDIIEPNAQVTQSAKINLTVQNSISIALLNSVIDFGSGYINTSCDAINLNSKTYANLTAGLTYSDETDCWTGNTTPTSFVIENNGNVNVSLKVAGPSPNNFFSGYTGVFEKNITLIARNNEPNSCASGLYSWPTYNWVEFSENKTICNNLKYYPDSEDSIAIDVNVLIPVDLQSGVYENSSIEFFAQQV